MELILQLAKAFVVGGSICLIGQFLLNLMKLTPAKILVLFVVSGVFLSLFGIYEKIVDFAGAGATVPLPGFGHLLFKGVKKAILKDGLIGIATGGLTAAAGGISTVVFAGVVVALIVKPRKK